MREIGSEFWEVPVTDWTNKLFLETTQWYLSGRSALQAVIAELGEVRSISLPSWCCDSMIKPFVDAGLDVHFYPVYLQEGIVQDINLDSDALFIMDYFGYTGRQPDLSSFEGVVIRDVTHSLFSTTYEDADYYFGSLRKWCGVWTGGYAWTKDGHQMKQGTADDNAYVDLRKKAMLQKAEYINDKREDKGYLKFFEQAENFLDNIGIIPAVARDISNAKHLDIDFISNQRRLNAQVLLDAFSEIAIFKDIQNSDCPMFVPIMVPDGKRNALRQYLIDNSIFCPVHWPVSKYHRIDIRTEYIYKNALSLVCDQRYTEKDMSRMVKIIKSFLEDC